MANFYLGNRKDKLMPKRPLKQKKNYSMGCSTKSIATQTNMFCLVTYTKVNKTALLETFRRFGKPMHLQDHNANISSHFILHTLHRVHINRFTNNYFCITALHSYESSKRYKCTVLCILSVYANCVRYYFLLCKTSFGIMLLLL